MARKKSRKVTRRRTSRRGIGKINAGGTIMNIVGVLGGVAVAGYINKFLFTPKDGETATDTQVMLGKYAPLVLGVATPLILKSELGKNLGAGMIAYGGAKILQGAGLGNVFTGGDDSETLSIGYDNIPALAGNDDFAMAGYDYAMAGSIPSLAGLELEELDAN